MPNELAGGQYYVVVAGDGMSSIAARSGHFWQTIWNDPANAELKAARREPQVLLAGDRVYIPPLRRGNVAVATGRRHTFRRKGTPARFRLRVQDVGGKPFAGRRFELTVGQAVHTGTTGEDGMLETWVTPTAERGQLIIFNEDRRYPAQLRWIVRIGHLEPIETLAGVQARLTNLGLDCGGSYGTPGPLTDAAVRAFRKHNGLEDSPAIDDSLREKLREAYGY